ncbi:unnamed protein product [Polarella glacialis]|uniref:Uncharacterized protein n=1 Tax=Polarella glacialis TaxID=89957 RepID=A0A813IXQ3_POLGL|nr:unnamed protein product [Polarella glacialis]
MLLRPQGALTALSIHEILGIRKKLVHGSALQLVYGRFPGVAPPGSPGCHCLEFDSWWNEGRTRRFVYIRYNIAEGAFQMAIDEDSNLYHVPVAYGSRTGEAVTVWDLHVGAELDILGRMTTLQRCSQTTAQWNKYWAGQDMFQSHQPLLFCFSWSMLW